MDLANYFENTEGTGILGTCDSKGNVDLAIYARPHVIDENTIAFIMRERLSHENLKSSIRVAYMFIENTPGYKGVRLYLTKQKEETNQDLIAQLRRRQPKCISADDSNKYLVYFSVDSIRPLVGGTPPEQQGD